MHPNGGAVESVGSIREVGNYSVSKHMLAHHVLATKIVSVCCAQHFLWRAYAPIGGDAETCYFRSRRWQSVCQQAHALPFCVLRTRRWQSACPQADTPALLCLPHMLSPRTTPFICPSKGGMGACPHVYPRPLTFCARMPRRQNPPALPAPPAILLPVIACSHRMCAPGKYYLFALSSSQ